MDDFNLIFSIGGLTLFVMWTGVLEVAVSQIGIHQLKELVSGTEQRLTVTAQQQARAMASLLMMRMIAMFSIGGLCLLLWREHFSESLPLLGALGATIFFLLILDVAGRRNNRHKSDKVIKRYWSIFEKIQLLFSPISGLVYFLTKPFADREGTFPTPSFEDLHKQIVNLKREGMLVGEETEILKSVFMITDTIAKEVMKPRVDMVCVKLGSPVSKVFQKIERTGHSRFPVYEEDLDHILGFVHAKDLLRKADSPKSVVTRADLRQAHIVPSSKKIIHILRELQASNRTMVVAVDEYGGTDGLLTLEDIVEEIVGEIHDEYDRKPALVIESLDENSALIDARMILEDVNERLDIELPTDNTETIGGYVYELLGHVPSEGEVVEAEGNRFTIVKVNQRRIVVIKLEKLAKEEMSASAKEESKV